MSEKREVWGFVTNAGTPLFCGIRKHTWIDRFGEERAISWDTAKKVIEEEGLVGIKGVINEKGEFIPDT